MDGLRSTDPSRIGGHRLLGRLGAGGMGVVYLGRTDGGELAAVKVILPEYADDEEFRSRFRREVEAARSVRSDWAVAVTGAQTEGERPWLATAFVPGPSLEEAVTRCGPFSVRGVRVLGQLLARALTAVHTAGLVHRDVKPGNVLLAVDGPRLIDFGIARHQGAALITVTDLVVGTPGFLSPEQAAADGTAPGPASDIFSLGCLLAYAATGRPPFGSGAVDALIYRTVHDEPDLSGVDDPELRELLAGCLSKDPADRPTARGLDELIIEDATDGSIDWLPRDVVRLIEGRSAAMLALPAIHATVVEEPAPAPPGRRRFLRLAASGAVVAAGGGAYAARKVLGDDGTGGSGAAKSGQRPWIIGVQGDLSGTRSAVGRAQERGVRIAVERFNFRREAAFTLKVVARDDRGDPKRALRIAGQFARDREVLAVVGPTDDATTGAVLGAYDEATLPLVTVSSLAGGYAVKSGKSFFQASPTDFALAGPIVDGLLLRPDVKRLGVLIDRVGGRTAFPSGYAADMLTGVLAPGATYPRVVPADARDLAPVVADMLAHDCDAFFYAGDAAGAARTARALAATSFKGPRMAMYTAMDPVFLTESGTAAAGWEFTTPYTGATAPAAARFAAAHRARFEAPPAPWAAEAYDVAGLVIAALTRSGERPTRAALVARIAASRYKGVSRTYAFDDDHLLVGGEAHLFGVGGGRFRYLGPAPGART